MIKIIIQEKLLKKLLFSMAVLSSLVYADEETGKQSCILSVKDVVEINWKSYKTAAKIGVGGSFDDVSYTAIKKEGKNFKDILVGSKVLINTNKVNSKNKGRDLKLVNSFFKIMKNEKIEAKIIDIKAKEKVMGKPKTGTIIVEITMNKTTKKVPLSYIYDKDIMRANGFIDILDFEASKALASINKACFDLHDGKTWSDVEIGFVMNIEATLCDAD